MDISQLEYFAAVARVKSMTKAARLLNLTQPALSMSIKRIEEEIGVPLFDRSGRTVSLNENGETFYNAATEMLRLYYEAKDTILTQSSRKSSLIKLVAPSLIYYPGLLHRISAATNDASVSLASCNMFEVADALDSGEIDLCITGWSITGEGICSEVLEDEPLIAYVSENHPIAKYDSVSMKELSPYRFAGYTPMSPVGFNIKELCIAAGFRPRLSFSGITPIDLIEHVRQGNDIMFMTRSFYQHRGNTPGMKAVSITDPSSRSVRRLYWSGNAQPSSTVNAARDAIIEYFKSRTEI